MTTRSDWVETQTVGGSFFKNLSKPGTTHDVFQLELNTGCPYTGSLMVWFYRRVAAICSASYIIPEGVWAGVISSRRKDA